MKMSARKGQEYCVRVHGQNDLTGALFAAPMMPMEIHYNLESTPSGRRSLTANTHWILLSK